MDRHEEMVKLDQTIGRLKIENKRLKNTILKKNRKIKQLEADFNELESWHNKVMNAVHSMPIDVESFVGCSRYPDEDEEDD